MTKTVTCDEERNCFYDMDSKDQLPDDLLPLKSIKKTATRRRRAPKVQIGRGKRRRVSVKATSGRRRRRKSSGKKSIKRRTKKSGRKAGRRRRRR